MLHDAQRISAPSSIKVSISTAVWIVMWSEPAILAPLSGFLAPYSARVATRPGISTSAMAISLRPQSARLMSLMAQSLVAVMAVLRLWIGNRRGEQVPPAARPYSRDIGGPQADIKSSLCLYL